MYTQLARAWDSLGVMGGKLLTRLMFVACSFLAPTFSAFCSHFAADCTSLWAAAS